MGTYVAELLVTPPPAKRLSRHVEEQLSLHNLFASTRRSRVLKGRG